MGMIHYNRQATKQRIMRGERVHWVENSPRATYIRAIILSVPPWVDQKDLKALNEEAARVTQQTRVEHHLDHIIPVNHPDVCGLTVPWNLRIAPWKMNISKGNKFTPWDTQLALFPELETEDCLAYPDALLTTLILCD
jgi:hypothetical protein